MAPPSCPMAPALLPCSLTGGPWPTRVGWPQRAGRQTRAPGPHRAAGECGPGWGGAQLPPETVGGGCRMEGQWGRRSHPPRHPLLRAGDAHGGPMWQGGGDPALTSFLSAGGPGEARGPWPGCKYLWRGWILVLLLLGPSPLNKGPMSCPMLLGLGQRSRTVPCPQQGATRMVPSPRAGCGTQVPCRPVLPPSAFPTGSAWAAWGAGTAWPRGTPGTAWCPCKYQPPCALGTHPAPCPLQSVPDGSVCRRSFRARLALPCTLELQGDLGTHGCWCQGGAPLGGGVSHCFCFLAGQTWR